MKKYNSDSEAHIEYIKYHFNSTAHTSTTSSNFINTVAKMMIEISQRVEDFIKKGSGWLVGEVIHFDMNVSKYRLGMTRGHTGHKKIAPVRSERFLCDRTSRWTVFVASYYRRNKIFLIRKSSFFVIR